MKKTTILLFFIFISLNIFSQSNKEIYSKARIYYNSSMDIANLLQNGIPVDHALNKKNVFVESVFSNSQLETAKKLGFSVEILTKDMQKHIANRKNNIQKNAAPCGVSSVSYQTPANFELGSMGGFYTLSEMLQELDDMHTLYPNLITAKAPISNFQTFEGRSIYMVKISDNPTVNESEPEMLYTAIHHAREPAAMQQLIFYMWYLLENYATNNEVKAIVDNSQLYFVPIVNVDGYRYNETTNPNGGGFWRKNRKNLGGGNYGVDNNRNYSYHWGESGVSGPSGDTYPGTAPFSEIENQAIKWLCEQHNFQMALNNHTYSSLLLYPFGYANNVLTPDNTYYQNISGLMVQDNGYINEISADLYPAAGDSDDWMYGDTSTKNKIFAFTPEIGNDFWPAQSEIIPICKDMMYLNLTAAHLITNYAKFDLLNDKYITSINTDVLYNIKRLGIAEPSNFTISIVPISSNIASVGNPNIHNGMTQLQELTNNSISLSLDPTIQQGDLVSYTVVMNNGSFDTEFLIERIYGTPNEILLVNGNSTSLFNSTAWGISQSSYYSAPYSLTDSPNSNYNNYENSTIAISNSIDLTDATQASLSFYTKWDIEKGWDYVQFEISIDNGASWIPQCGKYTNLGTTNQGIQGEPMYDGVQGSWVKEEIDLSDYIGENIKFRFQLVSDSYTTADGFYFDDLQVFKFVDNSASIAENDLNKTVQVYPNPANDRLFIDVNNSDTVQLRILDINGKIIYNKILTNNSNNINISKLTKGIYFVKLTSNNWNETIKLIKN